MPQAPVDIVIDVPDLIIKGQPTHAEITIDVPDLIIRGQPTHADIVIDVPDLVIIGETTHAEIIIDVPDLIITGETTHAEIVIEVPDLIIIGAGDEDEDVEETREDIARDDLAVDQSTQSPEPDTNPSQPPQLSDAQPLAVADWCHGSYAGHFGRGLGTALGMTIPVGQNLQAPAEVTWTSCTALEVSVQGQPVPMIRTPGTRDYAGPINMGDGVARTLRLTCDADFNMRGSLVAADANLSIERPVWLIRNAVQSAALPQCDVDLTETDND